MDEKTTTADLNLDEALLKQIFDFLPYPFLLSRTQNGTRQIVFVNNKFINEIGWSKDEIPTQQHWFEKAYPDATYRASVVADWDARIKSALAAGSTKVTLQVIVQTKSKGPIWYEVSSTYFTDIEVVAFVNINEVKKNEARLAEENLNRDKILSILSHDLRSPVANLVALTRLFHQSKLTAEEFAKVMNTVHADALHTYDLVETILTWTKSNFNKLESKPSEVNLHSLIYGILDLFDSDLKNKKLDIELVVTSMPGTSDPAILSIVLRNLISNAIKFSPPSKKISIRTDRKGPQMVVTVSDSGMGISPEEIQFITTDQSFSQAGTFREKGFGLGLRLCREFLPLIGGKLEIESTGGEGTSMIVTFPF